VTEYPVRVPPRIPPYLDDPVFYADMIDAIGRGARVLADTPTGVMLRTPGRAIQLTAADADSTDELLDHLDGPVRLLVAHDEHSVPVVQRRFGFERATPCYSSVFQGTGITPVTLPGVRIEPLGPEWAQVVADNYHPDDLRYAVNRLEAGVMLGAFRGDTLLGFIGQHSEGAMGLLDVLPEYRHHGIATVLLTRLTHDLLAAGRVPYDHIIVGNDASEQLQRKLGFTISTRILYWMS